MKRSWDYRIKTMMLPGLKRWILIILLGICTLVLGVFLLLGYHPITVSGIFVREVLEHAADVLPHRISGIIIISAGGLIIVLAIMKMTSSVLGAYLPGDRESVPEVLFRRRHLDRGPKVVVVGGGTGLSNLLRGLKNFTNNITAIVTVGDDGGSSGRLRQELGVLPPGDIRNCITALADEEKLVTELFRYRFEGGQGLEGHSFGNLFITALCSMTDGDMIEAVRVAGRVLNSCGQVLPSTLAHITLVAELEDGRSIRGESQIPLANGRITRMRIEPAQPAPTPEALEAIMGADLIVLGPGSLYTSIIPNLLAQGICDAIRQAKARKIFVCNVMTEPGETTGYSVSDHVQAVLTHAGCPVSQSRQLIQSVLINDEIPHPDARAGGDPVRFDPDRLRELSIRPVRRPLLSRDLPWHHDAYRLAKALMYWFYRQKSRRGKGPGAGPSGPGRAVASFF